MKRDYPDASDRLEYRARQLFDAGTAKLDTRTRARLAEARHAAMATRSTTPSQSSWVIAAAGVAGAAILAAWLWTAMIPSNSLPAAAGLDGLDADLELLLDDTDLELLEDLEFYAWLDEQTDAVSADGEEG